MCPFLVSLHVAEVSVARVPRDALSTLSPRFFALRATPIPVSGVLRGAKTCENTNEFNGYAFCLRPITAVM